MHLNRVPKKQKDFRDKLDDNLVLWLRFNEGAGTTAYDSSRQFNHGTIDGATFVDGKVGEFALDFDGNDNVSISEVFTDFSSTSYTIAVWIKHDSIITTNVFSNQQPVFSGREFSGNPYLYLTLRNSEYQLRYEDDNDLQTAKQSQTAGSWVHLICVFDNTNKKVILYKNGANPVSETLVNEFEDLANEKMLISKAGGLTNFTGQIDDIRIYNRALSAPEVEHLYTLVGGT